MAAAERLLKDVKKQMRDVEKTAADLGTEMNSLGLDDRKIADAVAILKKLSSQASDTATSFGKLSGSSKDISVSSSQIARNITELNREEAAAKDLRDVLIEVGVLSRMGVSTPGRTVPGFGGTSVFRGGQGFVGLPAEQLALGRGALRMPPIATPESYVRGVAAELAKVERTIPVFNIPGRDMPTLGSFFSKLRNSSIGSRIGSGFDRGGNGLLNLIKKFGDDGSGGSGVNNFFRGILPGGARPGPAAIATLAGLGIGAAPALVPAAAGLGMGATAGLGALIGAAGTLKLAFSGITAAAFSTQKAFDALTPVQKTFVTELRKIDAGFVGNLESTAQNAVLPGLTKAIKSALSPAAAGVIQAGVGSFGGAISSGAQGLGKMFGSTQFQGAFSNVLQADAGYLKTILGFVTNLFDAFIHLQQAAIPLTDWLYKGVAALGKWVDNSVKAQQVSGGLSKFFEDSRVALKALAGVLVAAFNAVKSLVNIAGFSGAIGVVNLLRKLLQDIADIINKNRMVLHDFFSGALQAANDLLAVIKTMLGWLTPFLTKIDELVKATVGWRGVIDSLVGAFAAVKVAAVLTATATRVAWLAALGPLGVVIAGALLLSKGGAPPTIMNGLMYSAQHGTIGPADVADMVKKGSISTAQAQSLDAAMPGGTGIGLASTPFPGAAGASAKAAAAAAAARKANFGNLPAGLGLAVSKAMATGKGLSQADAAAYAYYQQQLAKPGLTAAQKTLLYSQQALYLNPSVTGTPTPLTQTGGINATSNPLSRAGFSLGKQGQLTAAETMFAQGTGAGTDPLQNLKAAGAFLQKMSGLYKDISVALAAQTQGTKAYNVLLKEQHTIQLQINKALAAATKASKAYGDTVAQNQIEAILGIGTSSGVTKGQTASRRSQASVRTFLNEILKQFGLGQTGSAPLGPFVKELYKLGDINKNQYRSLEKILLVISKLKDITGTIQTGITGNISQRLAEIKQELQAQTGFTLTGAQHSLSAILRVSGAHLTGSAAARSRFLEQGQYALAHQGMVLTNAGAALGVPLTHGGSPSTTRIHLTVEVKGNTATDRESARIIAAEVAAALRRKNLRNSVQMTGSNAGVNMGL